MRFYLGIIRKRKHVLFTNKMTWNKHIPFKWSFCLWISLRNKLLTDDRVISFGHTSVTRCVCYIRPHVESVDHIFSRGHFAKAIWKVFIGPIGFPLEDMPLQLLLMKLWIQRSKNEVHKLLSDTLPIIIC